MDTLTVVAMKGIELILAAFVIDVIVTLGLSFVGDYIVEHNLHLE